MSSIRHLGYSKTNDATTSVKFVFFKKLIGKNLKIAGFVFLPEVEKFSKNFIEI